MEKRNFLRKPVPEMDGRTERGALWHLSNVRSAWRVQVQGKVKGTCDKYIYLFLGQKYKENGMVMRYVEVGKKWTLGFICGDKGPEMYNASEELSGVEIARAYFEPGKKVQIDYHKHDSYMGKDFWDDCNLYGMANIPISAGLIMSETYEEMKGTIFQYSALQEYAKNVREVNPIDYLERYSQTPQIEVLVKMGLTDVVEKLVKCYYGIVADENARRPDQFLGIRKERVKQLIRKKGDTHILGVMQMEKRQGQNWTDEQVEHLGRNGFEWNTGGNGNQVHDLAKITQSHREILRL